MSKKKVMRISCVPGETIFDAIARAGISHGYRLSNFPTANEELVATVKVRHGDAPIGVCQKKRT